MKGILACLLAVSSAWGAAQAELPTRNRPGLSLRQVFELYVRCVQGADLEGLFTTVTTKDELFFVTSRGELIDTREGYHSFHERWFKETAWEMPVELVEAHEGTEEGFTLARFHFRQKDEEGRTHVLDSYFLLVFHKEGGMWRVVADVCAPIARTLTEGQPPVSYTPEQSFFLETIKNRRTVRRFRPDPVPPSHLLRILDAARYAPTTGKQQPWKLLVIRDRARLDELRARALEWYLAGLQASRHPGEAELASARAATAAALEGDLSAPVFVAVLVDGESACAAHALHDGVLAAANLMIAARALGYGTGSFNTFFPEKEMKRFLGIPERYRLICFTPVGVPEEWPPAPPEEKLEDVVVFERFAGGDTAR